MAATPSEGVSLRARSSAESPPLDTPLRVALVCMPFASAAMPSIQIGLLAAVVKTAGFPIDAFHLNIDLAVRLGPERYEQLCGHRGHMTGEWLFASAAFGAEATPAGDYVRAFPSEVAWARESLAMDVQELCATRDDLLPGYVDACLEAVDWGGYRVVGFTSTFQQNVASLALARRIKERFPHVAIVVGGANMEDEMGPECLRAFPCVDYVVVGEADIAFPELLRALQAGEQPDVPGVVHRSNGAIVVRGQAAPVQDLDALPTPEYEEFYRRARELGHRPAGRLPFESSRGCWWGKKHHCTFCGLNGLGMAYRVKSAERVLAELGELTARYEILSFEATDNILFPQYVPGVFAELAKDKVDFEFFYEIKSNLRREQLQTMWQGGVRRVQPGIESMSTHILSLMDKGATMLQNVRTLKWCRYYGIRVNWNLLCGFPGETSDDYRQQLDVLRLLSHLEPPGGLSRIWLERFSPYFMTRDRYPIRDVRPEASYRYVYPAGVALERMAYFFDYSMDDTVPAEELYPTDDWVTEWRRRWASGATTGSLAYQRTRDAVIVRDQRDPGQCVRYMFDGPLGRAYEYCSETARSIAAVTDSLGDRPGGGPFTTTEVLGALNEFCRAGLMVGEAGEYLSLALPANPNW